MDARCKQLTASWVRERHISSQDIEVCDFYETLEAAGADAVLEPGVYTLQVRFFMFVRIFKWGAYLILFASLMDTASMAPCEMLVIATEVEHDL